MNKRINEIVRRACVAALAITMAGSTFAELPDRFCEYIQTDSTYIKTGLCPIPNATRMVVDLALTTVDGNQQALFGAGNYWGNGNSAYVVLNGGVFRVDWVGSQLKTFVPEVGTRYVFDCQNNKVSIDGTTYSSTAVKYSTAIKEMYIFNENNNGSLVSQAKMRLYSAAVWLDGTTRDAQYVPCVKDGVAGLYNVDDQTIIYGVASDKIVASDADSDGYRINEGKLQVKITVNTSGEGGSLDGSTCWMDVGSTMTLTATLQSGKKAYWDRTVPYGSNVQTEGTSISFTVPDSPVTVSCTYMDSDILTPITYLQDAIDAASEGATIKLMAAEFLLTNQLTIAKPITIVGAGRDLTTIKPAAKGDFRGVEMTNAGATIKDLTITGFQNTNNSLKLKGIGLYMTAGTADTVRVYKNANKKYNMAANYGAPFGAGIWIGGGVVTNSLINGNYAESGYGSTEGVGVFMQGGLIVDSEISDNYRDRNEFYGAGVAIKGDGAKLLRCRIVNNTSKGKGNGTSNTRGMGIYMTANGIVEGCHIVSNGISAVKMSKGTLKNCVIWGHETTSATYTPGVEMSGGNLYNCTIAGNTDAGGYPGLAMTGGTAINNIISGNSGAGNAKVTGGTFMTNMVCAASVISTTKVAGNMTADPAFTNPGKGDYSIGFSSSAYDAGATLAEVTDDILGVSRPQGEAYDIGCYEYKPEAGSLQAAILIPTADYPEDGTAEASVRIAGGSGTYTCQWFVDGSKVHGQTGTFVEVTDLAPGYHDIKVIVSDGTTTTEATKENGFNIHPSVVYVDLDGGNEYPYNTSGKAASNIKDALDAVWCETDKPGKVIVAAGTYYLASELLLAKAVQVIGKGRDVTILNGSQAGASRVAHLEHTQALLRDLTITGATNTLYGAGVYMGAGMLDTVRVTANHQNTTSDTGNHGAGVYMVTGVVTNSIIDDNSTTTTYGGTTGIGIYMEKGLVDDCEICENAFYRPSGGNQVTGVGIYLAGGTLRNSRIHNNRFGSAYSNVTAGKSGTTGVESGMGVCMNGSSALVENCHVYSNSINGVMIISGTMRNSAVYGHRDCPVDYFAGVNLAGGTLLNCTITDNYASGESTGKSGLWMTGGTAINNIVYGNGNNNKASCYIEAGTFKTNLTDNVTSAALGNISADPNFVNAKTNDFHLAKGSPAIDTGVDVGIYTDIEGTVRPQKDGYDMGCYEYVPSTAVSVAISTTQNEILLGRDLTATVAYENIDPATSTFTWVLTDASGEEVSRVSGGGTEHVAFACTSEALGSYTLNLSVKYNGKTYNAESVTFTVKPGAVYVALDGSDEEPYDTPAKATTNLNAALSALWQSGDATTIVHVAAGEYELGDAVSITMPVQILGAGRDETVLNCRNVPTSKRPMTLNNAAAILRDLTLTGATNSLSYVGSCARMDAGLMDNVHITKNFLRYFANSSQASQAGGLYLAGGVATNMLIDRCTTDSNYGNTRGLGVYMTGGLLTDSVVCSNKLNRGECYGIGVFMTDGVICRTKIIGNTSASAYDAFGSGLAMYHGTADATKVPVADSCEIRDNTSAAYMNCGVIRNSLIVGGNRTDGRVAGLLQEGGTVVNCTIAGNVSTGSETADYSLATLTGYEGKQVVNPGIIKNSIAQHATVTSGTTANCLFNADPLFVSPKDGFYRLKTTSPAIDKGDNAAWDWSDLSTATDLKGAPRLVNDVIDLGCYERPPIMGFMFMLK